MFKRFLLLPLVLAFALLLASCGNSTSSNSYSTTSTSNNNASSTPTATPTAASTTAGPVIKTTKATVNGSSQDILTDAKGMTLYYFTPDTATTSACTDSCASTWPPLFFDGTGSSVPHVSSLQGTFSLLDTASKKQIAYNGHPLYTYGGDSAAGQTNGEGIGGKWFVATPTLKMQGAPKPDSSKNGY